MPENNIRKFIFPALVQQFSTYREELTEFVYVPYTMKFVCTLLLPSQQNSVVNQSHREVAMAKIHSTP